MNLNKDRTADQQKCVANSMITAIVVIGVLGLSLMVGGAIALKIGADLKEPAVVFYMFLSFAVIGSVEFLLMRQLSRVVGGSRTAKELAPAQPLFQPALVPASEARAAHLRSGSDTIGSVTEGTTRTLEPSFKQ
jgi:hypothetical protein